MQERDFIITRDCCCGNGKILDRSIPIRVFDLPITCPTCNEIGYVAVESTDLGLNSWHPRFHNLAGLEFLGGGNRFIVCLGMGGVDYPHPPVPKVSRLIIFE